VETTTAIAESSWTGAGSDVLARACEHYGGIDAWEALRKITLFPGRLSGLLPWVKGVGKTFPLPGAFEISPHRGVTRFVGYPDPEHHGVFEKGAVRIERMSDGFVVAQSGSHRHSFAGLAGVRRWQPLDALYFFGYALAHYHSLPFTLAQGRLIDVRTFGRGASRSDVLDVELPVELHTHSRRQQFYFDSRGMLVRHDYHAEIVGFAARAAHYWNQQTRFNGFPLSLDRRVFARVGSVALPITALHATFVDAEVEFDRNADPSRAPAVASSSLHEQPPPR
jgi:hypothetical protein